LFQCPLDLPVIWGFPVVSSSIFFFLKRLSLYSDLDLLLTYMDTRKRGRIEAGVNVNGGPKRFKQGSLSAFSLFRLQISFKSVFLCFLLCCLNLTFNLKSIIDSTYFFCGLFFFGGSYMYLWFRCFFSVPFISFFSFLGVFPLLCLM